MKKILIAGGALVAVFGLAAADFGAAAATSYSNSSGYQRTAHSSSYNSRRRCKKSKRTGTVVGGLTGAFLGSQIAGRGARTEGMVIGAGVGAVGGHQVAKRSRRCR